MNNEHIEQLIRAELARRELARRSFKDYIHYVNPSYQMKWFHNVVAEKLELILEKKIKKLAIFVPPQHGKLLSINELCLTTKGWKKHGDLQEGDYVFSEKGKPVRVLANSGAYKWPVQKVLFQDGKEILASPEHMWKIKVYSVYDREREEVVCQTNEIFNRRNLKSPYIDVAPAIEMPEVKLPIDPYLLGVWLGNGHSNDAVLTINGDDIDSYRHIGPCEKEDGKNCYRMRVPGLRALLRDNNLLNNKHIPIKYLLSSKKQREALLQGLMDTDGTCDIRGNCEFSQKVGGSLGHDTYVLMRSLGYKARAKVSPATLYGRDMGERWRIFVNPDKDDKVFRTPRKANRLKNKINSDRNDKKKLFIKSVEDAGEIIGNCIQVEGGMYLAGPHLIPTHNSELASKLFPSFVIGKKPETKIALCSYSAELSEKINADVQGYITSEEYNQIFDHIRVPIKGEGSKSTGRLDIMRRSEVRLTKWKKSGGYVIARGIGGSTTGMTVDLLIIDDPVKDLEDANSVNIRDKAWEWYVAVAQTRMDNSASQILIQTRWHQDDLSGRILSKHGIYSESNPNGWVVVSLPGLKTEDHNDYDPRSVGEALWPEKHSAEKLLNIKSDDVRVFDALIQQDPKPNSDALVYPDWKEIAEFPKEEDLDSVFYGLDFGFTNDPTALVKIGKSGRNIYLDEIIYEKGLGPHALRKKMVALGVSRFREIYADHEPAIIHDLKYPKTETGMDLVGEAFHILKAEKAIFAGISTVKEYRVFYTARSVNIKHEKNNYAWKYVGGMNTNEPIDRDNHCFTGDTLITTIDGQKRIDRIVEGDLVLTSDGWRPVTRLFKNGLKAVRVTKLKFSTHETIIKGTPDHKIKTTLGWMDLRDIRRGDALFSPTGVRGQLFTSEIRLQDVQVLDEYEALVYDIEVDDMHEYFANGVLVHNCMDAIRYGIHTKYRFRGLYYGPSITYS